ncbi:hypothetical protein [Streptomyces candidus]|uniref:Aromatic ring-opening dioxygenase LigA n=1 Tax=Streptomyces candidus TaxID=67283 RepID=A0A7X0HMQ8_9ACTN|nr:hypothetical protein [Streptomyces candidus]MBB6439222.1 hypothetical protein [Streptomyces candidus]GHH55356.1 hypothetical protein GCM10018773_59660 [Streptomyces candidus]
MTQTTPLIRDPRSVPRTGRSLPLTPARRVLRALAVLACVPYISLKVLWIAGGRLGIPDGSVLLERPGAMAAANAVTVVMDACVIVLALLLTQAWGRRVPAPLLVLPMWVATGLLAPIMAAFPLQLLVKAFGGDGEGPAPDGSASFLDPWVFGVVYGGFIVQGIALGALFVLYAKERWAHLWQGRTGQLPTAGGGSTAVGGIVAVLAVAAAVPQALRAAGGDPAGEGPLSVDLRIVEGVHAGFAVWCAVSVLALLLRPGRGRRTEQGERTGSGLPVKVVLSAAWVTSGAVGCTAGWMLVTLPFAGAAADTPATLTLVSYAAEVILALFALVGGTVFLLRLHERHTA